MTRPVEEPRKLTPTERLHEVTMAVLQRQPSPPEHTVGLTLNARGEVQIEVTGRGANLDMLAHDVCNIFDGLRKLYPRGTNGGEQS